MDYDDRLVPPIALSKLTPQEREAYARGLEHGANQLATALTPGTDPLQVIADLREQAATVRSYEPPA